MTNETDRRDSRSRRSILLGGAIGLIALFVVGALVNVPRIQRDLRHQVTARLAAAGIEARIDFDGQTGTLRCADPLVDATTAHRIAAAVDGVRSVTVDPSCTSGQGVTPASTTTSTTTTSTIPPDTTVDSVDSNPSSTSISTTSTVPAPKKVVSIQLENGTLRLNGTVATAAQQQQLRTAAQRAVDPANVVDALVVDAGSPLTAAESRSLARLVAAVPVPLVSGEIGRTVVGLYATGVYVDDAAKATFERAARIAGIIPVLTLRPAATAADAAALETELNTLVKATPILFRKAKDVLDPASTVTVQRVAGIAKRFSGLTIEVQGHTDSVGDPVKNQTLSEQRAQTVLDALVALGVLKADLTAKGFGETQLITDQNGNEIPDASRRVVFGVTTR